jgi:hypothetical protein
VADEHLLAFTEAEEPLQDPSHRRAAVDSSSLKLLASVSDHSALRTQTPPRERRAQQVGHRALADLTAFVDEGEFLGEFAPCD